MKFPASPICGIAALPASIASAWRKPVVRENTRTSKRGSSAAVTVTDPVIAPWSLQRNVYVPGCENVCSIAAPPGLRDSSMLQFELDDVSVCAVAVWSNSQRTVDPAGTVTSGGCHAAVGRPRRSWPDPEPTPGLPRAGRA